MKLLSINGSPKAVNSTSAAILDRLEASFGSGWEKKRIRAVPAVAHGRIEPEDLDSDILLVAFPLYVDGLPAPLLQWLMLYREAVAARKHSEPEWYSRTRVFAVGNCGFYEGAQNEQALRIIRNFAQSSGLVFGAGLGIGCGGMIAALDKVPDQAAIKRPVAEALAWIGKLASDFTSAGSMPAEPLEPGDTDSGTGRSGATGSGSGDRVGGVCEASGDFRFVQFAFPRMLYILAAHSGWRSQARAHGLAIRELRNQPCVKAALMKSAGR